MNDEFSETELRAIEILKNATPETEEDFRALTLALDACVKDEEIHEKGSLSSSM